MTAPTAKQSGWAYPSASAKKAHFLDDGLSLCGRWAYFGVDWGSPLVDEKCKGCRGKLS